jgi:hypothetical protein
MLYLALLPLLALPVLSGIAKREPHYLPICDAPADGQHRLAVPYTGESIHLFSNQLLMHSRPMSGCANLHARHRYG